MKWDGVRAVAYVERGERPAHVAQRPRHQPSAIPRCSRRRPALGRRGGGARRGARGVRRGAAGPSFGRLQERMHVSDAGRGAAPRRAGAGRLPRLRPAPPRRPVAAASCRTPSAAPLLEGLEPRRADAWRVPPSFPGPGADVLAASREHGLEGVVAKRLASAYLPGRRSPDWRKVKHLRMQEVVVAGWRPGQGRRAGGIGSLMLGVHDGRPGWSYAGGVGTGFTERDARRPRAAARRRWHGRRLPSPRRCRREPRPGTRTGSSRGWWARSPSPSGPSDGRLRHPSWRGLRPDKRPAEVRKEV